MKVIAYSGNVEHAFFADGILYVEKTNDVTFYSHAFSDRLGLLQLATLFGGTYSTDDEGVAYSQCDINVIVYLEGVK